MTIDTEKGSELTPKELEVLALFAEGYSLAEIGRLTYRSRATIKNHCANVHRRLGVHSTAEAVLVAVREGWLHLSESEAGA